MDTIGEEIKPPEHALSKGNKRTILLSEDEEEVRKLLKIILENSEYNVIEAVNGKDAVVKFMDNKNKIHLIILDMIMPGKNGKEAYAEIKKARPDMKVILMSGYSEDMINTGGNLDEGLFFISKPIAPTEFLRKIREVIEI